MPSVEFPSDPGSDDGHNDQEDKENTQVKLDKVDQAFDELMVKAANSPEAEKIALEAVITQMRQIAEQMKLSRDMQNLHELKKQMLEYWQELQALTQGNPELLKDIQNWGSKFVEQKILFIDLVDNVKNTMIDRSQEIQDKWSQMQISLGKISAMDISIDATINVGFHEFDANFIKKYCPNSGLVQTFIENITKYTTGHDLNLQDIDLTSANNFLVGVNRSLREVVTLGHRKHLTPEGDRSLADDNPDFDGLVEDVRAGAIEISGLMKDLSRDYMLVKKIHETHFLELFSQQQA